MAAYVLSTHPIFSETFVPVFYAIEIFIILFFTVEYICRVYFAKKRVGFVFSFFGIVDFLAFAPYYLLLFTGVDTRALSVARIFRLLRLFELFRYSKAIKRLAIAFKNIKDELVLFGAFASILLFVSAVGIYHFEKDAQPEKFQSVFDGIWWAMVTLTTVGYGDVYPITAGGKIFTFFIILVGLGIIAVPTGLMVSGLQEARKELGRK